MINGCKNHLRNSEKKIEPDNQSCYTFSKGKAPTPKWMLPKEFILLSKRAASPVCRRERHFYFCSFLLSRKENNATNSEPNAVNVLATPSTTIMVSKTVIYATSSLRYGRRITIVPRTICALSYVIRQAGRIGSMPPRHGYFPCVISHTVTYYHYSSLISMFFLIIWKFSPVSSPQHGQPCRSHHS